MKYFSQHDVDALHEAIDLASGVMGSTNAPFGADSFDNLVRCLMASRDADYIARTVTEAAVRVSYL